METNRHVLKRILKYTIHYRIYMIISFICALMTVLSALVVPVLCGKAIDHMTSQASVNMKGVITIASYILMLMIVSSLCQWLMSVCNNKITYGVSKDLRNQLFSQIQELPLSYLDQHPTGDLVSRMIADIDTFTDGLLLGFTQLFTGILTIIGTLGFMLYVNWVVTLVVVGLTPLSLFVAKFIATHTYQFFQTQSEDRGNQTAYINEMMEGMKVVQTYGYQQTSLEDFKSYNQKLEHSSLNAVFYSSLTNPSTRFVNNLVYAAVGLVGAYFVVGKYITVGELSVFLSYATQYAKPFNDISSVFTEVQNAIACASRVFELLDAKTQVQEKDTVLQPNGKVELKDVSFSYTEHPLIEDFNLSVEPGQRVAIVGPTGCGKTTLINLLMRFYDVNGGSIKVADIDVKDVTRHSLRKSYGMVLQDTWLKQGTIKENIAYGKPEASQQEIINAAKAAHAHSFIKRMPSGYDTVINEDGAGLSQGQKQLLCITRVMLSLPPMLILDEATSSIDTRTEMRIQRAFNKMMQGRTSFIVAHRLSTIKEADVILVMNQGHIVETGNHESLMKLNGFYANLYNSQFVRQ